MGFLEIKDVRKTFGAAVAVESFNLSVERGEFVSFLGPSGCGKTTTLRMVAGFETPTAGSIVIDGVDVTNRPPNQRRIGMVFQSYALFPNLTVAGNVGFGLKVARRPAAEIRERVAEMLRLINLESHANRYPNHLSGGQQQRVALARALAISPQVLLLDEPLSALDAKIRVSLRAEIKAIQRQFGITTIYVTHDQEEAMALSDRIVVMSQGRAEQVGPPFEIYNAPRTAFVAAFVGMLNVLQAEVVDPAVGHLRVDGQPIIRAAGPIAGRTVGAAVSAAVRPEALSLGDPVAGANCLRGALEDVTFLGPIVRLRLRLGRHTLHVDAFNRADLAVPRVGEVITASFPPAACFVLDDAPTLGSPPAAAIPADR